MRKTGLKMRIISMLLCFLMVITSIPTDAFAAEIFPVNAQANEGNDVNLLMNEIQENEQADSCEQNDSDNLNDEYAENNRNISIIILQRIRIICRVTQ